MGKDDDSHSLFPSPTNASNLVDLGAKAKIGSEDKHNLWEIVGHIPVVNQSTSRLVEIWCRPALHPFLLSSSPMFSSPLGCVAAKIEDGRVAAVGRGSSRVLGGQRWASVL
jgi:hypothetical protein